MEVTNCLNCTASLEKNFEFCPQCGQAANQHRLNLSHISHEVLHFFTHADKGILFLVKELFIKPGIVIREYIEGKRKKYYSPLSFFLVVIGLFVFVQTTFHPIEAVNLSTVKEAVKHIPDKIERERKLAKLNRVEKGSAFLAKYSNVINFVFTPIIALIFFLFYFRSGYNFTEHLVANLFITGINALFFVFIVTPYSILARGTPYFMYGIYAFFAWETIYRTIFYYRFINKKGTYYIIKPLILSASVVAGWYFLSTSLFEYYITHGHLL